MENNTDVKTLKYSRGLNKDLNFTYIDDQIVTHARNAVLNTHLGDVLTYSDEPSTLECVTLPYKFNGQVSLKDNRFLVFSSDNINSEIGIVNLDNCTYEKLIDSQCIGLNNNYIVTGIVKLNDKGEEIVIFNDGLNPPRIINLSDIPKTYTISTDDCNTKLYSNNLDCDALLIFPNLTPPCAILSKSNTGALPDGSYEVGLAYSVNGVKFSDVYSLTLPIMINNEEGDNSIIVDIQNLDVDFPEYELYLIGTVNGITTPTRVGVYSTSNNRVVVSKWNTEESNILSNIELVTTKKNYKSAGIITSNSQYAMLADLTRKDYINVQKFFNQVKLEYVVYQYPEEYYKNDGQNIGYYRDENYRFYGRYFYGDGEPTLSGFISGRSAKENDLELVYGDNVYETYTQDECEKATKVLRWQAENTAGPMKAESHGTSACGVRIGYGEFGYYESTEKFPDDVEVFGDKACTNMVLHQFPDECKVPRYSIDEKTGKRFINILGFRAKNIPYPTDDKGVRIPGIVGYEILRSDRDGSNKTVVSRGLLSNMRGYDEKNEGEIVYSNYPYNDLTPDQFLSKKQVYKDNKGVEQDYEPLDKVYQNRFSFYGPHNYFFEKYKIGTELKIETEEIAAVKGNFVPVYNHPKHKLLTNFSLSIAGLVGSLEAYLSFQGRTCTTTFPGTTNGTTTQLLNQTFVNVCDESGKTIMPIPVNLSNAATKVKMAISNAAKIVLNSIAFLGVAADFANKFLDQVRSFSSFKQYAYQYNSYGLFTKQKCFNHRRKIVQGTSRYLKSAPENVNDFVINNYKKEESLFLEIERDIPLPLSKDTTRRTITKFGLCKKVDEQTASNATMYYGTIKVKNPGQYGTISNMKPVKTHNCVLPLDKQGLTNSPDLFGGDCIIYRFTVNKKQPLFKETLADKDFPNGTALDYRQHRIIGYPRFFADFTEYDTGNLMNLIGNVLKTSAKNIEAALPDQKYNLDCKGNKGKRRDWIVSDQYMYTSVNGVLDFFVEADYNFAFRKTQNEGPGNLYQPHYGTTSLEKVFRSDVIDKQESFVLDPSYRKVVTNEIFSEQLLELNKSPLREKNSIIYSLPAFTGQKFNNWQYFLPNNYFTFDEKDFGELTGIHSLDQDKVIFLFSKSSPFISLGKDELQTTSGRKIIIGDGGLFAQQPRELMHTDVFYGSSLDKHAFRSTQFGHFYVSRNQGKIFNFTSGLNEVSREGLHFWCSKYMPLKLLEAFPNYPFEDSPQTGVGYMIAFDNIYELIYICKRDYSLKEEYKNLITYDTVKKGFYYNTVQITLGDVKYFNNASWTLSYSPANKSFSSFHDWHPDWVIQQENHFTTIKGNTIYKHNERCDSYCNFYGIDYPYELEVTLSTGQNVNLIRSFEFVNEVYHNKNNCKDRFHMFQETFDQAEVYNSEQHSGVLNLEYINGRKPSDILYAYPKVEVNGSLTIPYDKKENHYRFNMFHDVTKDRGQNLLNETQMYITEDNGYVRNVNPLYIDLNKPRKERKNMRHYFNSVLLRKNKPGPNHFISKFQNFKITKSNL